MELAARRLLAVLLGCVAVLTLSGYLLKAQCIGHYNELRDSHLCSNDIQVLYLARGMHEHPFPYVHGALVGHRLVGGALEYPVLTGLFAWFPALLVHDDGGYLRLTALLLSPFSFLTVWLLGLMVRWRALLYALAPPLVWYSFHNWDLLVVCATVAAFHAWWRRRYAWAGAWLAVGACLKFWPLLFVLPLLLDRLSARDRAGAGWSLASFAWVFGVVNGLFLVLSPSGWWAPYAFQQERAADITSNSVWFWGFPSLTTHDLNTLVPVLLLLGTAVACAVGWWRASGEGCYPFVQVCGAVLAVFMLTNKAHSPQYALWLLPFFCLVRLRWGWWLAYMAFDLCTYVGVFRWYYALSQGHDFGLAKQALVVGVWGRAVMLVLLFGVLLRADPAFEAVPEERVRTSTDPALSLAPTVT
ncbi:MAG: glycosyltransferase 87 family protein [Mycobacteriales bacterium]